MKKNVKYIGSAVAVALLAAGAPVVVPMIIPDSNITVSADGIDYNPPADLPITKFLSDFMNQFEDQYVSNDDVFVAALNQKIDYYKNTGLLYSYFDPQNPAHMRDLQSDPAVGYLKSKLPDKIDNDPLQNGDNYYYRDVLGSLTLTDGNDQPIVLHSIDDYRTVVDKFKSNKIVFPITVDINLVKSTSANDGVGTYNPPSLDTPGVTAGMTHKTVVVNMSKFDVTEDTTTPNATVGTKLSDISSTDNKNTFNITDRYADTNKDGARTPIYGQSLFTGDSAGRTAALAYAKTATFDPTSTTSGNVSSGTLDSDGKILKTGKYYQTITYKLANDTDKAIDAMLAGTEDDSTKQKVSPYSVFINGSSTAATDGTDYAYNKDTGTITVLRPINVMDIIKPSLEIPSSSVGELASSLKDTTGDKLVDDNGQTVPTSDINIDDTYYTDKTVNNPATGLVGSDGTFTKAGTYWRKITFTLRDGDASSITDNGGAINATGKQLTYVQEVDIKDSAKLTVADATANAGDPTSVASATTGNDVTGKDGSLLNQDEGDYKGVSFGTDYYDVNSDSVSKSTVLNGTAGEPTSDVVTDGKFTKAGTYLRTITFYLTQGAISNNAFSGLDPDVKESERNSTVTYVQTITISPNDVTPTISDVHTTIGTSVTDSGLHDPSTVELPNGDDSLLDKTKGDNNSGISFGNVYYDDSTLNNTTNDISTTNKLTTAKTYHRLVTFYLTKTAYDQSQFKGSYTHSDQDNSVSYVQDVIVDPSTKTATFGNHDLEVPYNTATNSNTLTGTSDYTLADDDGSTGSIEDSGASLDGKYYASEADAKAGTNDLTVANLTDSTYYRVITIKVKSGDGYLYSYPGASSVDAENDEVQYIQKISVDKEIATVNVSSGNIVSGNTLSKIESGTNEITDSSGKTISTGVVGTNYYDNMTDAINNSSDTSSRIITDGTNKRVTGPKGTIYRTITFTLNSGSNYTLKFADSSLKEGTDYKIDGDTITYVQPINITVANVSEVTIKAKTVNTGTKPADIKTKLNFLSGPADIAIKYQPKGSIPTTLDDVTGTLQFGTTYYDKDAYDKGDKKVVDVLDADGNFNKAGSFYRAVTIPLKNNYASSYNFNVNNQYVSVDTANDTVTYLQEVDVVAQQGKGDAPDKHTYTGVPITDLNTASDYTLTNNDGTVNLSSGVTFGTNYYPTAQDAVDGTNEIVNADTNGDFDDAGDYYRTVTFTVNPDDAGKYEFTDEFNGEKPVVTTANDVTTVTYVQHIHVDKNVATATITHEKAVADSNIADVPQPDPTANTLLDKNIHTIVTNDGKDVTADNSQYYDSDKDYNPDNTSKYVVNGKFTKATTYYRRITFNLIPGVSAADDFEGNDVVLVSKTDNSVTYLQAVDVEFNKAVANIVGTSATVGQSVTDPSLSTNETSDIKNSVGSIVGSISYGDSYYKDADNCIKGVNPLGKTFATAGDFYRIITFNLKANALDGNTLDDTVHTTTKNSDGTVSVSYAQKVTVAPASAEANIAGTTTTISNIMAGSSVKDEQGKESNDVSGITSDGTPGSLKDGDVQFGTEYYDTTDSNNTFTDVLNGASTIKATDGVVSGDKYVKPGTYYRTVTVPLQEDASLANSFDPDTAKLSSDGKSVTYVQTITIEQGKSTPNIAGTTTTISNINAGSSVKDEQDKESNDVSGITANGTQGSLKAGDVQFGTDYYDTTDSNNTFTDVLNGSSTIKATDGVVSGDKYVKPGTYYRTVTVPLQEDASLANSFDPDTAKLSSDGKSVTYVQTITIGQGTSTSSIAGTAAAVINVAADSDVGTEQSAEDNTVTGITSDGKTGSLIDGDIQFGTNYYDTTDSNNTFTDVLNGASTIKATDGVVSGGKYVKPGTYYRTVTVPLQEGASIANSFDPDTAKLSSDGKSVTFVQTITVGKNSLDNGNVVIKNLNVKVDGDPTLLTSPAGYKLTDKAGNNLIDTTKPNSGVSFSSDYIDKKTGETADAAVASGAKITKAGTYTRQVIFNVTDEAIKNNDFTAIGGKLDPETKTVTFTQTVVASANPAASVVTNPSVSSGTNADSATLKNPKDVSITDGAGKSIVSGNPTFGGIFKTPEGAENNTPAGGDATGNLPAGTYYQKVTVPLEDNADNAYDFGTDAQVDKTNNTVSYIRTITVNPSTGGGGSSNEDDEWTYYKNPGVVTTKTDQNYYYMNHKDNSTVANRTLVKGSSWITDQYRTNRAGVKQYRVATDEWVDSRYVYFLDKSTDNNNTDDDEWTYFKAPGIVTTKTDQNYYYMNHKDDSAVENRTLAKDSSWLTDQYRTNREGVKQYRVATDEWVDSNSVIFTQNVITGISSIKGVVNLDSTNAYYMLYTKEGNVVGNRALKEKSSWLVDEVGRDAQGNVYYRVASNEWVKVVPGVYFDSKAWY